jgi:hypothetical protein
MNPERVVLATTTKYENGIESDEVRKDLALQLLSSARKIGYKVIVVDSSNNADFSNQLRNLGIVVHLDDKLDLTSQRNAAYKLATQQGTEFILWTEPEKTTLIDYIPDMMKLFDEEDLDIVVPRRKSLSSYPSFQQETETEGNATWKRLTGIDLDVFFGPRVWRKEVNNYFLNANSIKKHNDKWALYIPLLNAVLDNKKVGSIEIDYYYPQQQAETEENSQVFRDKRLKQLANFKELMESRLKEAR